MPADPDIAAMLEAALGCTVDELDPGLRAELKSLCRHLLDLDADRPRDRALRRSLQRAAELLAAAERH